MNAQRLPKYLVDTCSFTAMRRIYPADIFPGAWGKLNELAEAGILISAEDVFEELKVQDDEILEWANKHQEIFIPLDDHIQKQATKTLQTHKNLVDLKKRKSGADPFVIATAIIKRCVIVTEEKPSGGPHKSKIPDVCKLTKLNIFLF